MKVTKDQYEIIYERFVRGEKVDVIAKDYDVSSRNIQKIVGICKQRNLFEPDLYSFTKNKTLIDGIQQREYTEREKKMLAGFGVKQNKPYAKGIDNSKPFECTMGEKMKVE